MRPISYIIAPLLATALVACKPAARYALHEASDPAGGRVTLRIDTKTGETAGLASLPTAPGGRVLFWANVIDQETALAEIRALDEARKSPAPSQP